jgi:hypothetical protein
MSRQPRQTGKYRALVRWIFRAGGTGSGTPSEGVPELVLVPVPTNTVPLRRPRPAGRT